MLEKLEEIEQRFESIESQLQDPKNTTNPNELQRLGKARAELEDIVPVIREYKKAMNNLHEAETMVADPEMKELALDEISEIKGRLPSIEDKLKTLLIPRDPKDDKSVIIEIRPAACTASTCRSPSARCTMSAAAAIG